MASADAAHTIGETFYVYSTGLAPGVVEKIIESGIRLTEGALHNLNCWLMLFRDPAARPWLSANANPQFR